MWYVVGYRKEVVGVHVLYSYSHKPPMAIEHPHTAHILWEDVGVDGPMGMTGSCADDHSTNQT